MPLLWVPACRGITHSWARNVCPPPPPPPRVEVMLEEEVREAVLSTAGTAAGAGPELGQQAWDWRPGTGVPCCDHAG